MLLGSCIQRSILVKTLGHVRVFEPLSKQVSDPLMAVGFWEEEGSASGKNQTSDGLKSFQSFILLLFVISEPGCFPSGA